MKKAEIMPYIGKLVRVWTAVNGEYIGELLDVSGRPWRGKVRILAIVTYPTLGMRVQGTGFVARKPYGYNEVKDFGNSSVVPYTGDMISYDDSLRLALCNYRQNLVNFFERTEVQGDWHKGDGNVAPLYRQALDIVNERLKEIGL